MQESLDISDRSVPKRRSYISDIIDNISMNFDHPDQTICSVCSNSDVSVSVLSEDCCDWWRVTEGMIGSQYTSLQADTAKLTWKIMTFMTKSRHIYKNLWHSFEQTHQFLPASSAFSAALISSVDSDTRRDKKALRRTYKHGKCD